MAWIKEIRNFIGERTKAWKAQGWAGNTVPPDERRICKQAEEIGIRLFERIDIPAEYWRNSAAELERTVQRIEIDPEMQSAAHNWPQMSENDQKAVLQRAVNMMAEAQTQSVPLNIFPGTVSWVGGVAFEGNSPADHRKRPDTYQIELNRDAAIGLTKDFARAIKCALHEQIHIKQSNYAYAYCMGQLPEMFNDAARYFILQPEVYVPSWLSSSMNMAQPCEKEALVATNSTRLLAVSSPSRNGKSNLVKTGRKPAPA
jgi:hypothetical protein